MTDTPDRAALLDQLWQVYTLAQVQLDGCHRRSDRRLAGYGLLTSCLRWEPQEYDEHWTMIRNAAKAARDLLATPARVDFPHGGEPSKQPLEDEASHDAHDAPVAETPTVAYGAVRAAVERELWNVIGAADAAVPHISRGAAAERIWHRLRASLVALHAALARAQDSRGEACKCHGDAEHQ